jgi:WD40 repeat protein
MTHTNINIEQGKKSKSSPRVYVGLNPYQKEDSKQFYGRDQEIKEISNNLIFSPLTILQGESGVGKSSILNAGVNLYLEETFNNNAVYRKYKFAVVIFSDFSDANFEKKLQRTIKELTDSQPIESKDTDSDSGGIFIQAIKHQLKNSESESGFDRIFIIFDQFEDYFLLYQNCEEQLQGFEKDIKDIIEDRTLAVKFLFSIRSDRVSEIDRFKIRNDFSDELFENRIVLEKLSIEAAKDAIEKPIKDFYKSKQLNNPELELPDAEIEEGVADIIISNITTQGHVETPLLQLVMDYLWNKACKNYEGNLSDKIFLSNQLLEQEKIYQEKERSEGITKLVTQYFEQQLEGIATDRGLKSPIIVHYDHTKNNKNFIDQAFIIDKFRDAASLFFYHLVTPSGSKHFYNEKDLRCYYNDERGKYNLPKLGEKYLSYILEKLVKARILRPLPNNQYEIYHDVLCQSISEWQKEHRKKLDEKQQVQQQEQQQAQQKYLKRLACTLSFQSVSQDYGKRFRMAYHACQLLEKAEQDITEIDSDLRNILKINFQEERLLSKTENQLNQFKISSFKISSVDISPNGQWIVAGDYNGKIYCWQDSQHSPRLKTFSLDALEIAKELSDSKTTHDKENKAITCVELNDKQLGVGCANGKIYLISLEQLKSQEESQDEQLKSQEESQDQDQIRDNNVDNDWGYAIECLAFSPDGKWLFSGGRDSKIKVWNIEKESKPAQRIERSVSEHQDWVWSLEICPHNKSEFFLAAGYRNGTVVFWKLNGENSLIIQETENTENGVIFSTHIHKNWSNRLKHILRAREIFTIVYNPDKQLLACGGRDGTIRLWKIKFEALKTFSELEPILLLGHEDMVKALAFGPAGRWLLSGSSDQTLRIWDLEQPRPKSIILKEFDEGVSSLAIHADSKDPSTKVMIGTWSGQVWQLTNDPSNLNISVQILRKNDSSDKGVIIGATFIDNNDNNQYLLSSSYDARLQLWNRKKPFSPETIAAAERKNEWNQPLPNQEIRCIAYDSITQVVALAGVEGVLELYHVAELGKVSVINYFATFLKKDSENLEICSIAFTTDRNGQKWLAIATSNKISANDQNSKNSDKPGKVLLWQWYDKWHDVQKNIKDDTKFSFSFSLKKETYEHVRAEYESENKFKAVTFSPDGKWLIAGGDQSLVCLWKLPPENLNSRDITDYLDDHSKNTEPDKGKNLYRQQITEIVCSKEWLVVATDKEEIHLWRVNWDEGKPLSTANEEKKYFKFSKLGTTVALSDETLAIGGRGGIISLFSIKQSMSIQEIQIQRPLILKGHTHNIRSLNFSSDGNFLASGSDDTTIRIWVVQTETLKTMVAAKADKKGLNEDEWKLLNPTIDYETYEIGTKKEG